MEVDAAQAANESSSSALQGQHRQVGYSSRSEDADYRRRGHPTSAALHDPFNINVFRQQDQCQYGQFFG